MINVTVVGEKWWKTQTREKFESLTFQLKSTIIIILLLLIPFWFLFTFIIYSINVSHNHTNITNQKLIQLTLLVLSKMKESEKQQRGTKEWKQKADPIIFNNNN